MTPAGADTTFSRAISVVVALCCAVMVIMWLTRWPSRRQSVLFVVASNACIAISCLVYAGPETSLLACTAFAALAGYVAFFHTSRLLAIVLFTAAATTVACAIELAMSRWRWPSC